MRKPWTFDEQFGWSRGEPELESRPLPDGPNAFETSSTVNESFPAPARLGSVGTSGIAAQLGSNTQVFATTAVIPTGSDAEITFLSGVTLTAKVAAVSFGSWNGDSPATYDSQLAFATKWGSTSLSTS